MYPEDLRYYQHFDTVGLRITGYPWAGDVYHTYATRTATDALTGLLAVHSASRLAASLTCNACTARFLALSAFARAAEKDSARVHRR